jgi:hypothetical protein
MDTFLDDADSALRIPDTGTTAEHLRQHLHRLVDFLSLEPAGRVMLALVGQAQHDRAAADVFQRRYLDDCRAHDRTILERGVGRGDVRDDVDLGCALVIALSLPLVAVSPSYAGAMGANGSSGSVVTTAGGAVRDIAGGTVDTFLGLPYAAPPVGPLRWQAPQPPAFGTDVRDATNFAPACRACAVRAVRPGCPKPVFTGVALGTSLLE